MLQILQCSNKELLRRLLRFSSLCISGISLKQIPAYIHHPMAPKLGETTTYLLPSGEAGFLGATSHMQDSVGGIASQKRHPSFNVLEVKHRSDSHCLCTLSEYSFPALEKRRS